MSRHAVTVREFRFAHSFKTRLNPHEFDFLPMHQFKGHFFAKVKNESWDRI